MNILSCPKCKNELIMKPENGELYCPSCGFSILSTEYEHPALGSASKSTYIKKNADNNVNISAENEVPAAKNEVPAAESNEPKSAHYIPHTIDVQEISKLIPKTARLFLKSSFAKAVKNMSYEKLLIPVWVNECNASVSLNGVGEHFENDATSFYTFDREGTFTFDTLLTNATAGIDSSIVNSLFPYDINTMHQVSVDDLDNSCTLYPQDINADSYYPKIELHVKGIAKNKLDSLNADFDSTHNKDFNVTGCKTVSSILYLPVWKILYEHSSGYDDIYINGQTGKLTGRLPLSKVKFALWSLFTCGLLFGVIYGIYSILNLF